MQKVLGQFNDCFIYMDDVLVYDANKNDHLDHLKLIFEKIREAGLKLKHLKYTFFKRHLQYYRTSFSGEGVYPFKEKVETICNLAHSQICNQNLTYNRTSFLL